MNDQIDPSWVDAGRSRKAVVGRRPSVGDHLGPYRVVAELGEGGMGVVLLAERDDEQFRRRVAIKVIRPLAGDLSAERFRRERQILADLDHPAIARLFEGGVTEDGQPYLVMELVEGRPIDVWCREEDVDLRGRLRLFREVCYAVFYAHGRLIVHRDLKPSNIFVTPDGRPKLLDFGIAKLLGERDSDGLTTVEGELLCSPAYASPEQLRGETVGTASDVYSLGVVLYELLVGRRPHGAAGGNVLQLVQEVLKEDPTPPSAASGSGSDAARRELRGDLDALVLAALEREPERRYPSAEALATEVDRYLHGLPLQARPQTRRYRVAKFVRRHSLGVSIGVVALLVLLGLLAALGLQSRQLAAERDRAQLERRSAEQVAGFLVDLFQTASPELGSGGDVPVRAILERGVDRVDRELDGQPVVQARMLFTIAQSYRSLGLYGESIELHRRALGLRREHLGGADPDLVRSLAGFALALAYGGEREEARPLAEEAIERGRMVDPEAAGDALTFALNALGIVLWFQGEYSQAEAQFQEALPLAEVREGPDGLETNRIRHNLAMLATSLGRYEEARGLYLEALAIHRRVLGDDHATTATNLNNLGTTLASLGDWEGAEARFQEAIAIRRALLGPDHPWVASTLGNLAAALDERGDFAGAVAAYEETLAIQRRSLGLESVERGRTLQGMGESLHAAGELARAESTLRESRDILGRLLPSDHPFQGDTSAALADVLVDRGALPEALELARDAVAVQASLGEEATELADSRMVLGRVLLTLGREEEAIEELERSRRGFLAAEGEGSENVRGIDELLARAAGLDGG